jgi:hypothetical protein
MVCGWAGVLGQGPVADQVEIGFRDVAVRVVVGEGHEAAAALALQQHGPEADREAADADALPGG